MSIAFGAQLDEVRPGRGLDMLSIHTHQMVFSSNMFNVDLEHNGEFS